MATKLTSDQLLAQLAQAKEDAVTFKELWTAYFPASLRLPPDFEILSAVKRLALSDLVDGMQSYQVVISDPDAKPTTKRAMSYICGAGWTIKEQENPDQEFHPTARRQRKAKRDTNSPEWDGMAYGDASPRERQKILAENIAKQKQKKRKSL